jgi:hypothetical protein
VGASASHREQMMTTLSLRSQRSRSSSSAWLVALATREAWQCLWMSVAALILAAGELSFLWPDLHAARLPVLIPLWALSIGVCRMAIGPHRIG